jgi:lipid-binding SYLF domain-containing protein
MRVTILLMMALATAAFAEKKSKTSERLDDAAVMFSEIMGTADKSIPQDLLEKSQCVVLVPGLKKGAFIIGGKYGKGFATCRKGGGGWSAPAAMRVEGGSFGFQIGGSETDVVMLVMNESGMKKLMSSKFTLGGEASVAAGPVGRESTAQTDAWMRAEILSWSRSRGVFAGISLQGATLRQDVDDNQEMYGRKYETPDLVNGDVAAPADAAKLMGLLNKYSAKKG